MSQKTPSTTTGLPLKETAQKLRKSVDVPTKSWTDIQAGNEDLAKKLKGKLILAPLTKGGNLPFRWSAWAEACHFILVTSITLEQ